MKAVLCKSYGPPSELVLEELPDLRPLSGEILVDVKACGVNFPDTLIIQGRYQFQPPLPFSPGSDIAGIIREVGEDVKKFKPGDRVFGIIPYGGFAQQAVAPEHSCFHLPDGMSFTIGAAFLMAYATSYHALKDRGELKENETLVVLGAAGGVGLAAVELGKLLGARVIAVASSDEKLETCRHYGADEVINYQKEDLKLRIKELTQNHGADVIFDPVGGDYSEAAFRAVAWRGRHLAVGFAAGAIPKIPLNLPLLKGASIVGVFLGAFAQKYEPRKAIQNNRELLEFYMEGKIKPHIHHIYPLAEAPAALDDLLTRQVIGKVVIAMR